MTQLDDIEYELDMAFDCVKIDRDQAMRHLLNALLKAVKLFKEKGY